MSWEIFRCKIDCAKEPGNCISERLYHEQADAMVSNGFNEVGYATIHMVCPRPAPPPLGMGPGLTRSRARVAQDDCWERKIPPRDLKTGRLVGDPTRFPSGMKALGDCAPPSRRRCGPPVLSPHSTPRSVADYHGKGLHYALYTAESPRTCGGYPASANHEMLDAQTFADWGVE